MQAVSASIEYVLSTTDAAASGPMMEACTAGGAAPPLAGVPPGASPTSAVLIVSTSANHDLVDESQDERTDSLVQPAGVHPTSLRSAGTTKPATASCGATTRGTPTSTPAEWT